MTDAVAKRLIGWKRIAAHLGVSERTARRWEDREDLPVHRQQHDARSTAFAYPAELEAWLASRAPTGPEPAEANPKWWQAHPVPIVAVAVLIAVIAALFIVLPRPGAPHVPDSETRALYERGEKLWQQRGRDPIARSIKLFEAAVERDPDYADAWAGLARAWATYPTYDPDFSERRAYAESLTAANRALTLDPKLADVRTLLVSAAYDKKDWAEAERLYREAVEIDPDNPDLILWFAGHYRNAGMFDEATTLTERALKLDPQSPPILTEKAMNTMQLGDLDEGEAQLDYIWSDLGFRAPIVWFGRFNVAVERRDFAGLRARLKDNPFGNDALFSDFVDALETGSPQTRSEIASAIEQERELPAWIGFYFLTKLDLANEALDVAEAAAKGGEFPNSVILFNPADAKLRSTRRFARIAQEIGLLDYWRERGAPTVCNDEAQAPVCRAVKANADRR